MKNKKYMITISTLTPLVIFWLYICLGSTGKLNNFVAKEKGNISELFYTRASRPIDTSDRKIKLTKVKDLLEFRRYLFILPKAFLHRDSLSEIEGMNKSFPRSCKLYFTTFPRWLLSLGPFNKLFTGQAIFKCHQIAGAKTV
jgi:hypothetical protein